jgi:hypothetical protein
MGYRRFEPDFTRKLHDHLVEVKVDTETDRSIAPCTQCDRRGQIIDPRPRGQLNGARFGVLTAPLWRRWSLIADWTC